MCWLIMVVVFSELVRDLRHAFIVGYRVSQHVALLAGLHKF